MPNRRSIGDPDFKPNGNRIVTSTPDVRVVELNPSDTAVVLASDGLWDVLSDKDVAEITNKVPSMLFCLTPISGSCQAYGYWDSAFHLLFYQQPCYQQEVMRL